MRFLLLSTIFSPKQATRRKKVGERLDWDGHEVDFLVVDPTGDVARPIAQDRRFRQHYRVGLFYPPVDLSISPPTCFALAGTNGRLRADSTSDW